MTARVRVKMVAEWDIECHLQQNLFSLKKRIKNDAKRLLELDAFALVEERTQQGLGSVLFPVVDAFYLFVTGEYVRSNSETQGYEIHNGTPFAVHVNNPFKVVALVKLYLDDKLMGNWTFKPGRKAVIRAPAKELKRAEFVYHPKKNGQGRVLRCDWTPEYIDACKVYTVEDCLLEEEHKSMSVLFNVTPSHSDIATYLFSHENAVMGCCADKNHEVESTADLDAYDFFLTGPEVKNKKQVEWNHNMVVTKHILLRPRVEKEND